MEDLNYPLELEYFDKINQTFIKVNLKNITGKNTYIVEDSNNTEIQIKEKTSLRVISIVKDNFEVGNTVQYKITNKEKTIWKEAKIEAINGEIISLLDKNDDTILTRKKEVRIVRTQPIELFERSFTSEKIIDIERAKSILSSIDLLRDKSKFYFIDIGENHIRFFNFKPFVTEPSLKESELINNILSTIIYNEGLLSI